MRAHVAKCLSNHKAQARERKGSSMGWDVICEGLGERVFQDSRSGRACTESVPRQHPAPPAPPVNRGAGAQKRPRIPGERVVAWVRSTNICRNVRYLGGHRPDGDTPTNLSISRCRRCGCGRATEGEGTQTIFDLVLIRLKFQTLES